jgi:hypothetical protein
VTTSITRRVIAAAAGGVLAVGTIVAVPAAHAAPGKANQSQGAVKSAQGQAKAVTQQVRALVALLNRTADRYDAFAFELDSLDPTAAATLRQLAVDARSLATQVSTATTKKQVLSYRKDRVAIVKAAGPVIALLKQFRAA